MRPTYLNIEHSQMEPVWPDRAIYCQLGNFFKHLATMLWPKFEATFWQFMKRCQNPSIILWKLPLRFWANFYSNLLANMVAAKKLIRSSRCKNCCFELITLWWQSKHYYNQALPSRDQSYKGRYDHNLLL